MKFTVAVVAALTILLAMAFASTANEGASQPFWSGAHIDTIMDSQYVRDRIRNPQGIHVTDGRIYILDVWDSGRILSRKGAIRVFDRETQMEMGDESFFLAKENRFPVDIASDGVTMWVLDNSYIQLSSTIYSERRFNTGKVYAYNIATKTQDESREFRVSPASRPQYDEQIAGDLMGGISIATDGTTIWVRTSKKREPPKTVFHTAKPSGEILAAFNAATLTRDTIKDIAIEFGDGYVFQGSIETDGETIWVAKGKGQWYENLEAYSIATGARDMSKDFDGFPDFSEGGAGLWGPLSVSSMSLFCNTLYALNHSREEVYVIGHNTPPNCNTKPTQPSLDTSWILRHGYEDDYP
ncbi:MAG: hypothetical protein OXD31_18760 [Chloroflexi bacterium]|nr:hypothetical protein [Chloroflexota bacterium]